MHERRTVYPGGVVLRAAALLVALGGCDVVWGLESDPVLTCENPGTTIGLTVLADATLDGATALGTDGILRLTSSSRVLVRLRRSQLLDRISLRVAFADYAVGCQGNVAGCVPCTSSSLGMVDVYLVDNDWDETTVTGDERKPGEPWQDTDRRPLGTFPFGPTGLVRLESLDFSTVEPRFVGEEIALELVGADGTDARFVAREGNDCVDAGLPDATGGCESQGVCGDTGVGLDEDCDGTIECTATCEASACGDGVPDQLANEQCDDGNYVNAIGSNASAFDACDRNCTQTGCGNGIVTADEQCDDSDPTAPRGLVCSGCRITEYCGNGTQEVGEGCDDGNFIDGDNCDSNCTPTGCNNGIQTGAEECDDGNPINGDTCDRNCTTPRCGNGEISDAETCDSGIPGGTAACDKFCQCPPSFCAILD